MQLTSNFLRTLEAYLAKEGITKTELSRRLGITHPAVLKWWRGQLPRTPILIMIAALLKCPIDDLLGGKCATDFPQRLASIMAEKGINSAQLAEAAKISPPTVCHYLSGKRRPSGKLLITLSSAFRVNPQWLLNGEGPRTPETPQSPKTKPAVTRPSNLETALRILPETGLRCLTGWLFKAAETNPAVANELHAFLSSEDIRDAGFLVPCQHTEQSALDYAVNALGKLAAEKHHANA